MENKKILAALDYKIGEWKCLVADYLNKIHRELSYPFPHQMNFYDIFDHEQINGEEAMNALLKIQDDYTQDEVKYLGDHVAYAAAQSVADELRPECSVFTIGCKVEDDKGHRKEYLLQGRILQKEDNGLVVEEYSVLAPEEIHLPEIISYDAQEYRLCIVKMVCEPPYPEQAKQFQAQKHKLSYHKIAAN